jgi:hypothetical protein
MVTSMEGIQVNKKNGLNQEWADGTFLLTIEKNVTFQAALVERFQSRLRMF